MIKTIFGLAVAALVGTGFVASAQAAQPIVKVVDVDDAALPSNLGVMPGENVRFVRKVNFVGTDVSVTEKKTCCGGSEEILRPVAHPAAQVGFRTVAYFSAAHTGKAEVTVTHRVPGSGATTVDKIEVTVYATGPNKGPVRRSQP